VILSVHTHNDRGTGVASAELGLLAGAERVEGTLLGNGERSGNVDIVTLALNLYSHGIDPGLVFDDLPELVRVVTACTRLPVHPRHPYAGELVFTAFSGSHQDAIRKGMHAVERSDGSRYEVPYLPIDPADVGRAYERVIRINSQSGKGGVWHLLEREHGYRVPKDLAIEVSGEVQAVTDARGEELSSADVLALFERRFVDVREPFALENARVEPRADGQGCTVAAYIATPSGACNVIGAGNGPVEAFVSAIGSLVGAELDLADRSEQSQGQGAQARTVVYVALACGGKTTYGVGRDEDRSTASFRAILSAANRRAFGGFRPRPAESGTIGDTAFTRVASP
jgi:2-isopropylmalate synthase